MEKGAVNHHPGNLGLGLDDQQIGQMARVVKRQHNVLLLHWRGTLGCSQLESFQWLALGDIGL